MDPAFATASALIGALSRREVSAAELAQSAIARIEKNDAAINAVIVRDFARAREAAKAADAALARGESRPLLGLPMTVKEAFNVAGLPTTWGVPGFKDNVATEDSLAIRRLKDAGAIILGKTNVPVFLADWQSVNPIHGRTNKPWDLSRTAGGSSGGAAAVAAGMVPLEFGTDLGGSIRVPAVFCGIYGHKASFGVLPMRGFRPPAVPDGAGIPISVLGPLARSPDDLELVLDAVAGPEGMEARAYRLELPHPRHAALRDYRVLVIDRHPAAALDDEIADALNACAEALLKRGAKVAFKSDGLPDLDETLACFGTMLGTLTSRGAPSSGAPMSAHQWMDTLDRQYAIRRKWDALFEDFDVVLAPAFGTAAFPHIESQGERTIEVNGKTTPYGAQGAWSSMASLANLPATAAPIGTTRTGLPIGIQIIGPYLGDRTTIHFAKAMEKEFGGFTPPPMPA